MNEVTAGVGMARAGTRGGSSHRCGERAITDLAAELGDMDGLSDVRAGDLSEASA